jgi:hypothetical protein
VITTHAVSALLIGGGHRLKLHSWSQAGFDGPLPCPGFVRAASPFPRRRRACHRRVPGPANNRRIAEP